jgi:hypothetical protein
MITNFDIDSNFLKKSLYLSFANTYRSIFYQGATSNNWIPLGILNIVL